jgi:hypothetical protein
MRQLQLEGEGHLPNGVMIGRGASGRGETQFFVPSALWIAAVSDSGKPSGARPLTR